MKRVLSVLLLAVVLIATLGFSAGSASAAALIRYLDGRFVQGKGVVYIFAAEGLRNKDVKGAQIFVGSNFYNLGCTVDKDAGRIVCVVGGDITPFAGQTGVLYLAGQMFYVPVPGRAADDSSVSCPEGTVPGADVTFFTSEETLETYFVSGSSLSEVQSNANDWLGEYFIGIEEIGDLYCGEEPQ